MSIVQDMRQALPDTLAPEIRELKARLNAIEKRMDQVDSRMERNESAADRRHSEVLNAIRDMMEITHLRERIARLEAEREAKLPHSA